MNKKNLMGKDIETVGQFRKQYGYMVACGYYDNSGNRITEYVKVASGVVVDFVKVVFNSNCRVIDVQQIA